MARAPLVLGIVTWSPEQTSYPYGSGVLLSPVPNNGAVFSNWTGDLSGASNPSMLTMNGNKLVTAVFSSNQDQFTLALNASPAEGGSVSASPPGPTYSSGATVTLVPTANPGWKFLKWDGDLDGAANPAQLIMTDDKAITAVFVPDTGNQFSLTVNISPAGKGSVVLSPENHAKKSPRDSYGTRTSELPATAFR